ncbi:hypothetical protein [Runella sp.]|uniref:hypothetical protein n=1 Tax=Runella sp. TaxID=1960881 RepID=UPI003D130527
MENELIWMLVSELLESGYGFSVRLGKVDNKETWILENGKKEEIAYQSVKEGDAPFYNAHCLVEKQTLEVMAFMITGN